MADENLHPRLIQALRFAGHEVSTVHDLALIGADDDGVLHAAAREGRILVTADKDFGAILEFGALAGRGSVILIRYRILDWIRIAGDLATVLTATEPDFASDPRLWVVVEEGRYRVRRYPNP